MIDQICTEISPRFIAHVRKETWGNSIMIMESMGMAFCHVYWYADDKKIIYLEGLSVSDQGKGIGTLLLEQFERIARILNAKSVCLWVENGTWMHAWYIRKGYKNYIKHDEYDNAIWMKKRVKT